MLINDRIYGEIQIKEKVIVDLINSKPMQRLKKINQDGAAHFIEPHRNVTRFEHSIGVWYLSRKFNRPIEEQIAALLHDTPHTAFSHVVDFVMDDEKHEFHDKFTKKIILDSEIPNILKDNGVDLNRVLNKENYYLLENDLPDISVDRWDYFMRDSFMDGILPAITVELFLNSIKESKQKFYFEDKRIAAQFAIQFMNSSRLIWLQPTGHGSYFLLANALKLALKKKYISEEDFFTDDEMLWERLQRAQDTDIENYLNRLKPGLYFNYADKSEADFYGRNKPRYVDPWVLENGTLVKVSELVPSLKEYFAEFYKNYKYLGVKQIKNNA